MGNGKWVKLERGAISALGVGKVHNTGGRREKLSRE